MFLSKAFSLKESSFSLSSSILVSLLETTKCKFSISFSSFLQNLEDGRIVQVEIQGNNIEGVLADGTAFSTYAPNDPNLIEKLSSKNVTNSFAPR